MAEIKWIKITTSIFDDEAIKVIEQMPEGDALLIIWFKLLIRAGIINDSGLVYFKKDIPYTEDMLAIVFNKPVTLVRLALSTFEKFGMIEIADNQIILIRNWEKHQNADALELYNKSAKERMRRYRERQKEKLIAPKEENVTSQLRNALRNVTGIKEERRKKNKKEDIEYIPPPYIEEENEKKLEEEEEKIILSKEEEEILKSYAYNADRPIYDYASWRKKVIENGNYKSIIKAVLQEKEAQKQEYTTRPDCQEYIPPEIVNLTAEDEQKIKEIQEQIKQRRRQNNGSNSTKN